MRGDHFSNRTNHVHSWTAGVPRCTLYEAVHSQTGSRVVMVSKRESYSPLTTSTLTSTVSPSAFNCTVSTPHTISIVPRYGAEKDSQSNLPSALILPLSTPSPSLTAPLLSSTTTPYSLILAKISVEVTDPKISFEPGEDWVRREKERRGRREMAVKRTDSASFACANGSSTCPTLSSVTFRGNGGEGTYDFEQLFQLDHVGGS
jgi:hypothetical protein